MKIVALYCISGASPWLPFSFKSIYTAVDAIYFFVSDSSWHAKPVDNTSVIAQISQLQDPEDKARLFQGSWKEETEQRNTTLAYAQLDGFTHAFIVDADEIYHTDQLIAGFQYAKTRNDVGCFHLKWFTYWKSLEWRIDPIEPYDPAVLIRLGSGGFHETRNPVCDKHELIPPQILMCHHLSYVLSDQELKQKHIFESGHSQSCGNRWYEDVWTKWDSDHSLENLHPVKGEWFKRAVRQSREFLPPVLLEQVQHTPSI